MKREAKKIEEEYEVAETRRRKRRVLDFFASKSHHILLFLASLGRNWAPEVVALGHHVSCTS